MLALAVVVAAISLATWAGWALWRSPWLAAHGTADGGPSGFIKRQRRYQGAFLVLAMLVAVLAGSLANPGSRPVFAIGLLDAPAQTTAFGLPHLHGISWLMLGTLLTLGFGLATLALVYASLRSVTDWRGFLGRFGLWVFLLAAVNALSEELLYRGALVAIAQGQLGPTQVALLSAVLFALAHVRGQASGVAVIAGSALVGWCLAYAVLQTHGLFWAWCVHFTQDAAIFTAFIAAEAKCHFDGQMSAGTQRGAWHPHL